MSKRYPLVKDIFYCCTCGKRFFFEMWHCGKCAKHSLPHELYCSSCGKLGNSDAQTAKGEAGRWVSEA